MKERTVLLNIILALANQSFGSNKNASLLHIVDEAFELIRLPTFAGDGGADQASLIVSLKELAEELAQMGTKHPYDVTHLRLRVRTLALYHKDVQELLQEEFDELPKKDDEQCNTDYIYYHNRINTFVRDNKFKSIMLRWAMKFRDNPDMLNKRDVYFNEMNLELLPYISDNKGFGISDINGIVSEVDVDDKEALSNVYKEIQELTSAAGVLRLDLQGWNKAFGNNNGILRGTLGEIQAMSGCGKSETMRKMLTGIARCNDPIMIDPKKKPLIVYFTCEDTQRESYEKMFVQLYSEQFEVPCNVADFDYETIVTYVRETLTHRGYSFKVIEAEKHKTTPYDVISVMEQLSQQGYEIHAIGLDYMLLLDISTVPGIMDTYKIKNAYGIIGSYTKPRGIACITAAQVDDSAKYTLTESDEFAKEAIGKNLSAGSKYIIHELDWRVFIHVTDGGDGYWYHQFAIGKNRTSRMTPYRDKYAVYRMHMVKGLNGKDQAGGFIQSDLGGLSEVRTDTAGNLERDGGGCAF